MWRGTDPGFKTRLIRTPPSECDVTASYRFHGSELQEMLREVTVIFWVSLVHQVWETHMETMFSRLSAAGSHTSDSMPTVLRIHGLECPSVCVPHGGHSVWDVLRGTLSGHVHVLASQAHGASRDIPCLPARLWTWWSSPWSHALFTWLSLTHWRVCTESSPGLATGGRS